MKPLRAKKSTYTHTPHENYLGAEGNGKPRTRWRLRETVYLLADSQTFVTSADKDRDVKTSTEPLSRRTFTRRHAAAHARHTHVRLESLLKVRPCAAIVLLGVSAQRFGGRSAQAGTPGCEPVMGARDPLETTHARRPLRDCSAASLPLPAAAEPACSLPAEHARSAHTVSESASV